MINNGLNLFKQIVHEGNGKEISNFLNPGVESTKKNLISFSQDYSKTIGGNEFWYPETSDKLDANKFKFILPTIPDIKDIQKYFTRNYAYNKGYAVRKQLCEKSYVVEIIIPIIKLFEFFEQDKIYRGIRFEIKFTKNKNENMLRPTTRNIYKVNYINSNWIVPFYDPNYINHQYISEVRASNKALNYTWEESKIVKSQLFGTEVIENTYDIIETHRMYNYLYIAFQTANKDKSFKENNMIFDNLYVSSIHPIVNNEEFLPNKCNFTPSKLECGEEFNDYLEALNKCLEYDTRSIVSKKLFASLYPIYCFNVSDHDINVSENTNSEDFKVTYILRNNPSHSYYIYFLLSYERNLSFTLADEKMLIES